MGLTLPARLSNPLHIRIKTCLAIAARQVFVKLFLSSFVKLLSSCVSRGRVLNIWAPGVLAQPLCLIPSVHSHPTYLENGRPWNSSMGQESLNCVPSAHTNLKRGAYVTRDLLTNQGLQSDLPVRSGGGCFPVLCCWFRAVSEEECGVVCVSCSVCYCWVL